MQGQHDRAYRFWPPVEVLAMNELLVINADDFGRDAATNTAILAAFQAGYCSSATIMPNMPGFEAACELTHRFRLEPHIGMHLTLRGGYPLTDRMKRCATFCDANGMLSKASVRVPLFLSSAEEDILADEIRAQIARCRLFGLRLSHLDSHRHIHTNLAIIKTIIAVALEQGIPFIRLSRNTGGRINLLKQTLKTACNARVRAHKLAGTEYFGSVKDYLYLRRRTSHIAQLSMEIMLHPVLDAQDRLIDVDNPEPLAEVVRSIPKYRQAVSYGLIRGNRAGFPEEKR